MGILRLLLAISVVIAHSGSIFGFNLVGGQIAVQTFYIISGFYMALIINEKYIGINNSYKLFITNRLLRLYPVYWVVLILTVLFSVITAIYTNGDNWGEISSYIKYSDSMNFTSFIFLIFTNLFIFFQDVVMFLGLNISNGLLFFTSNFTKTDPQLYSFLLVPQAWTIGVELTFYLIAPFLVKKGSKIIVGLLFLSILLRVILFNYGLNKDPWSYRFFPTELVFFLLGIMSYKIYSKIKDINIKIVYLKIIFAGVLIFTVFFSFLPVPLIFKAGVYLGLFFLCLPFIFVLTKKMKKDAYIGDLSYPIYISHLLVISFITQLGLKSGVYKGLILTVSTILFSILLNELLSKRIDKMRQGRLKPVYNNLIK
jgi:peptidoglycan/LPS O-acetylase OafA/YrhL